MIRSMTGYGKGESLSAAGTFTVEIRSVNHRYGEVSIRMPRGFLSLENEVKRAVSSRLKRGKIDVYVQWEDVGGDAGAPQLDHAVARSYFDAFDKLSADLGLLGQVPLSLVVSQKGVLKEQSQEKDEDAIREQLLHAAGVALDAIDGMRVREGEALSDDLVTRRNQIADWVAQIGGRSPESVREYQQKLTTRLEQLLGATDMDPVRLAQEVALLADRCDITEELVRLASHFTQFDETLKLREPVGRKLDFLMQEMNREINTIGSKANDAVIASLVIQIKAEMEKMREQVQNVE